MFKLILVLILFLLFITNYYFSYFQTMPTFKHISHFNFYTYLQDKFQNRDWSFTWLDITGFTVWNKKYLIDYTWWVLKTDLKYLWPTSDKLDIYMPIFILHTWDTLQKSWDSLFTGLQRDKNFLWYDQYITWWNDFIDIWSSIKDWKSRKQTLYLWYFYTYCSMSQTGWIDAYYFDRYQDWNKKRDYSKNNDLIAWSYVCENKRPKKSCPSWYSECGAWWCKDCNLLGWCTTYECKKTSLFTTNYSNKVTSCSCLSHHNGEYWVCKDENNWTCDTWATTTKDACIDYYTWTINLNTTDCSLSGALWIGKDKKYFLIR